VLGGAEVYLQGLSERLVATGHAVTVATTNAASVDYLLSGKGERINASHETLGGVTILRFPVRHLPFSPYSYQVLRRLTSEVSRIPVCSSSLPVRWGRYMPWVPSLETALSGCNGTFDVVHGVNLSYESLPLTALRHARKTGAPFLFTPLLHIGEKAGGAVYRYCTMAHQRELFRGSTKIIVQTDREKDVLLRIGIEGSKIEKVGVAVDLKQIQGGDGQRFKKEHGIGKPLVVFVGRVSYDKGAVHLVQAIQQLWDQGREVDLVLVGPVSGRFAGYYESLPSSTRERVKLLGPVKEEEKRDLLDAAEMLVLPSRVDSFGIVFLEAWAYKKPVIGAAAGGVPEVIAEGEDGLLVPFGDVGALSQRIATLLDDEPMRRRLGEAGHRKVSQFYTWDVVFRKLEDIYRRLAG
jgi:glycosyltransferase involved in cell wall biosynthesis